MTTYININGDVRDAASLGTPTRSQVTLEARAV